MDSGGSGSQLRERSGDLNGLLPSGKDFAAWQVKGRILGIGAGQCQQILFCHGIDNMTDIAPVDGSGAHGTWFCGRVKCTIPQKFFAVLAGGPFYQLGLGVAGTFMFGNFVVHLFHEYIAVFVNEQGGKRCVAGFS